MGLVNDFFSKPSLAGVKQFQNLITDGEWSFFKQNTWNARCGLQNIIGMTKVVMISERNEAESNIKSATHEIIIDKIVLPIENISLTLYNLPLNDKKLPAAVSTFFHSSKEDAKYFILIIGYIKYKVAIKKGRLITSPVSKTTACINAQKTIVGTIIEIRQSFLLSVQNFFGCAFESFNDIASVILSSEFRLLLPQFYNINAVKPTVKVRCH